MKKFVLLFFLLFKLSFAVSLDALIKEALEKSPYIKEKKIEVKIFNKTKKEKSASRFGTIKAFGSYFRYEDKRILYPISPPISPNNLTGAENQFILGISYSVPVFNGFKNIESVKIADLNKELSDINYKLTKNQLIFNIKNLYTKILELEKQKKALKVYLQALKKLKNDIETAVKVGKKPKVDILKIEYSLQKAKANLETVENSINYLKYSLKTLIGDENIDLSNLEDIKPEKISKLKPLNALLKLKKLDIKENIQIKNLKLSKGKYFPDIYFLASGQRNIGAGDYKDLWQIGLKVDFTVFDFGKRNAECLKQKLKLSKIKIEKQKLSLEIKKQIKDALTKIKNAENNLRAAKKQLQLAKKIEKIEKVKYEEGISQLYDYLYAKAQKLNAESSVYKWFYEKQRATFYLKYILEEYKNE